MFGCVLNDWGQSFYFHESLRDFRYLCRGSSGLRLGVWVRLERLRTIVLLCDADEDVVQRGADGFKMLDVATLGQRS